MDKTAELGTKPIGKLLAQYSIPAVIAMVVNAIYNVVDRVFIGQFAGEEALAGLTIAFPVMMIIFAFANLIGIGGASLLSIKLGQKDEKAASQVFGNTLGFGLLVTAVILVTIFTNLQSILNLFGATAEVMNYATTYLRIIIAGFIFQMLSFILNSSVRTEGRPLLSMVAMISSALTNIVLDFVFIRIFGWGVAGAAIATVAGQLVGLAILVSFYLRGKSHLHLSIKDFALKRVILVQIVTIGFATFLSTVGTSIAMLFINRGLSYYGGVAAVTAMGVINSLYTFFIMPIIGITQGIMPIIGYNHGAKQKDRVSKTLRLGIFIGIAFSTIVFLLMQLFPTTFISMFLESGSSTVAVTKNGLRIFLLMLPLLSINLIGVAYFQAVGKGTVSMILGMLRQFLFLLPLLFILPSMWGLDGVWAATPIADGFAILVTFVVLILARKKDAAREVC
ncbi:putative efflux protein, MATE family [Sphaerochaeta pleomorpha str. Grapes]|uniref:Multidrug export protein MepA n=1 Tax=Sphaerochaeta pleomorpha (strain ATCC BAA-1885 / DSM 22778 / Grapes) TaxID=158190 RepID=G8QXK0_SPHPG|nr:MATE family efflux transporter [Sphaerochaeta pleomorpha]AEV29563.1 putative efflux protein, MATE family [Sphaerochaeta pleomorpha str. Grapes]